MTKRIIITVSNDLVTDQRVQRIVQTLQEQGYEVVVTGRVIKKSQPVELAFPVKRFRLWMNSGPGFYACLNIRLFWYLFCNRFDVVLSNDLDTLPGCRMAALLKQKTIVFDSHEYFTEVPELVGRRWQKAFWKRIEKFCLPGIKHAYTVCQSLADIYQDEYKIHFQVIRNLPYKNQNIVMVEKSKAIIYQGALNLGRGIEIMIDAMQFLPEYELWIAGAGDVELRLKEQANRQIAGGKIKFLGRLTPVELKKITNQAMLGLSLEEDLGLNYHFALPNKLFDYIQAKIPVVVSNLPEMRGLVEKYGVGEWIDNRSPEDLAIQIKNMLEDPAKMKLYQDNLNKAANELCWENEQQKLIAIFNQVFN